MGTIPPPPQKKKKMTQSIVDLWHFLRGNRYIKSVDQGCYLRLQCRYCTKQDLIVAALRINILGGVSNKGAMSCSTLCYMAEGRKKKTLTSSKQSEADRGQEFMEFPDETKG